MRSEKMKILRIKNNLTQEEISKLLKVSKATYNHIENGKKDGSKDFWEKLQNLYGLEDEEIWQLMKN